MTDKKWNEPKGKENNMQKWREKERLQIEADRQKDNLFNIYNKINVEMHHVTVQQKNLKKVLSQMTPTERNKWYDKHKTSYDDIFDTDRYF